MPHTDEVWKKGGGEEWILRVVWLNHHWTKYVCTAAAFAFFGMQQARGGQFIIWMGSW